MDRSTQIDRAAQELLDTLGGSCTLASRMVGEVKRYHVWHLNREQTVADHVWHVMRLYVQLFGLPDELTMRAILFHDVELLSSDVQFPFKRMVPEMKEICDEGEVVFANHVGMGSSPLGPTENWRLKACDLLEMYEMGTRECMSGNSGTGRPARQRIYRALLRHCEGDPRPGDTGAVMRHISEVNKWIDGGQQ